MTDDLKERLEHLLFHQQTRDESAHNELLAEGYMQLSRMTQRIFRFYPSLHRFVECDDILQNVVLRLRRSLLRRSPESVEQFLRLMALEIRHELIDQVRHFFGKLGAGTNEVPRNDADAASLVEREPPSPCDDPGLLELWCEFHEAIEALPAEERSVFDLRWYHEMTLEEVAAVMNRSLAWVKRYWAQARVKLSRFTQDLD